MDRLEQLMREHMDSPFPESVVKGTDYGCVDCVMVGADIYGWASQVAAGAVLPANERAALEELAGELRSSLPSFPAAARAYYEQIAELADEALRHCP